MDVPASLKVLLNRRTWTKALEAGEIARGAHLCWSNAVSLLKEARLLSDNAHLARALGLTVLALEELAKPPLLWQIGPKNSEDEWRAFWKEQFSRHSLKQEAIGGYGRLLDATGSGVFGLGLDGDVLKGLDRLKQWGFYVDCINGEFQSPDELALEISPLLDFLFASAEERADSFAQFHSTPDMSSRYYAERLALSQVSLKAGALWPPVIKSEPEAHGVLLSLASQYSRSQPPDYSSFGDAYAQLAVVVDGSFLDLAVKSLARVAYSRTKSEVLKLSARRGFLMMKLALHRMPKSLRQAVLAEFAGGRRVGLAGAHRALRRRV